MFALKTQTDPSRLENEIERLLVRLSNIEPNTDDYAVIADQLTKLDKLKDSDSSRRVSPDTLATVAANLAGIVLILNYERANIVLTKAVGFILKPR